MKKKTKVVEVSGIKEYLKKIKQEKSVSGNKKILLANQTQNDTE